MALVKDIQDRVREVAYMMWDSAGRQHGMAMNYWLAAERDVIETMQAAAERMIPADPPGGDEPAASAASTPPARQLEKPAAKATPPAKNAAPKKAAARTADAPAAKEPAKPAAKATSRKPAASAKPKTS